MKREIITISENGEIHIPSAPIWMSACEIADLLGAFSGKVNAQIKAIFKEGLLMETEAMQTLHFEHGFTDDNDSIVSYCHTKGKEFAKVDNWQAFGEENKSNFICVLFQGCMV